MRRFTIAFYASAFIIALSMPTDGLINAMGRRTSVRATYLNSKNSTLASLEPKISLLNRSLYSLVQQQKWERLAPLPNNSYHFLDFRQFGRQWLLHSPCREIYASDNQGHTWRQVIPQHDVGNLTGPY